MLDAIPKPVLLLCERLAQAGYRGWIVGGSVRDALANELGQSDKRPSDWDIATSATPEQVQRVFRRVIPTGIAHGTVTVLFEGLSLELTTLRGETTYSDGRHPDQVTFVDAIESDLARRDFTVNAIAYDPLTESFIDPHGGVDDIKARCLRAVGDPNRRFGEDGLRVLRAARFAATLEFDIEPNTLLAIRPSLASYRKVSPERIRDEWSKSLKAVQPSRAFQIMLEQGMLEITAPELTEMAGCTQNRHHAYDVWTHTLHVLDNVGRDQHDLRLAALLHDVGKPRVRATHPTTGDYTFYHHEQAGAKLADDLLRRLRYANETRERVTSLVRHHLVVYDASWTDTAVRRWLRRVSAELWQDVLALAHADVRGKGRDVHEDIVRLEQLERHAQRMLAEGAAFSTRDLALSGNDLIAALGITPGPLVGKLLRQLLEDVTERPFDNQRERLLARAQELLATYQPGAPGLPTP
ncbi:MAG TPA: HD domain-containing protein [Polyangiaceae bacterium]